MIYCMVKLHDTMITWYYVYTKIAAWYNDNMIQWCMIILLVMACGLNVQIVCCAMWHVHVGSVECSPGVCCILWGIKSITRLAGALLCL